MLSALPGCIVQQCRQHCLAAARHVQRPKALALASDSSNRARARRWVQQQCQTLTEADPADVNPLLATAAAALRGQPVLLRYCADEVASARHSAVFQAFLMALTRGGPGGVPRPLETHSHNPRCAHACVAMQLSHSLSSSTRSFDIACDYVRCCVHGLSGAPRGCCGLRCAAQRAWLHAQSAHAAKLDHHTHTRAKWRTRCPVCIHLLLLVTLEHGSRSSCSPQQSASFHRRYVNDMLAWVHQALADERDLLLSLFAPAALDTAAAAVAPGSATAAAGMPDAAAEPRDPEHEGIDVGSLLDKARVCSVPRQCDTVAPPCMRC